MPGGAGAVGYLAFAAVKAAGYTLASRQLKHFSGVASAAPPRPITMGLARTAVGIAVGVAYGAAWFALEPGGDASPLLYYAFLLPVRMAEWSLVLWWFLGRETLRSRAFYLKAAGMGTAWSYGLDAIGVVAAFVVPGGFWIC